jgi:hypothetical protein
MTAAKKLTPAQLTVLRDVKAGQVCRSESGHDLYACYDRAQRHNYRDKNVTAIVDRLTNQGLIIIGEMSGMQRPWHLSEQGKRLLSQEDV